MVIVEERRIETEVSLGKPIQDTTLMALPSKERREAMNNQVFLFLRALPNSTMKEVSKGLDIPINTITWRFSDLRKEGKIEEAYRDKEIHWRIK